MSKKAYKTISIITCVIAVIGLISLVGSVRAVNLGAFIIPATISIGTFIAYTVKS